MQNIRYYMSQMSERENAASPQNPADRAGAQADEYLAARAAGGDIRAYQALMNKYFPKLWRLARSILVNEQEAEDAVQDVFIKLWSELANWDKYQEMKFSGWIYRVTFNRCLDIKRTHRPTTSSDDLELVDSTPSPQQRLLNAQISQRLHDILKTLPDTQEKVLRLYYFEELSIREISDRIDKTEIGIKSLLKRGRASLRAKLEHDRNFPGQNLSGAP